MNAPSPNLTKRILGEIERIERRRLILKTAGFGALLAASSVLAVYGCFAAFSDASRSGFLAFGSLFFSDFGVVAASFSDFAFSMLESFPVVSVTILLSGVFFAVWSAAEFVRDVSLMRKHTFSFAA